MFTKNPIGHFEKRGTGEGSVVSERKGRKDLQLCFIQWNEPNTEGAPGYRAMEKVFRMLSKIVTILFSITAS